MADRPKPPPTASFNSPFAALAGALRDLPAGPAPTPRNVAPKRPPMRAVVRYERKGHGGKEATRIEQLGLSATELARWLKDLKSALGCGGSIAGADLLLQGDQRERLRSVLEKRGVGRVIVS